MSHSLELELFQFIIQHININHPLVRLPGVPSPGSLTRGCLLKEKASTPDAIFYGAFHLVAGVIKLVFLL